MTTRITIVHSGGTPAIMASTKRGWKLSVDAAEHGLTAHVQAIIDTIEALDDSEGTRAEARLAEKDAEIAETKQTLASTEETLTQTEAVAEQKGQLLSQSLTLVMSGEPPKDRDLYDFKDYFPTYAELIGETRPRYFPFTHEGRLYRTAQQVTFVEHYVPGSPGVESQFYEIPDPNVPQEWEQPLGHNPYLQGDQVLYQGQLCVLLSEQSVYAPGVVDGQWECVPYED